MRKSILFFSLLIPGIGFAQPYSVGWYKISGGGGASAGGAYSISGTVGQPDASGQMIGGSYSLRGGFWSLYALQTLGAPLLTITYINNQAVVSWPASSGTWTLQTNVDLATGAWGVYRGPVVNNSVTNSPPTGNLYFRLALP